MRKDDFFNKAVSELRAKIRGMECRISLRFYFRHDNPAAFKTKVKAIKDDIKELRQKKAFRIALEKQISKPVTYLIIAGEKQPGCPGCSKYLGGLSNYEYCPYCGQKLDWSDK